MNSSPNIKNIYNYFSAANGAFTKFVYIHRHKASFNRFKNVKITPYILSDHHGLKLKINNRKYINSRKQNNTPLNENRPGHKLKIK